MVVMGNPPYLGESTSKGDWIMSLMDDYKKEPGGKQKLQERNSKWINDDYVKFMRFGQHFIEKNGEGVLAFINPHGFLDNPTFRGMRWNLLKTYDEIYTIDLHGNAKKKETAPDGSIDENVFDIEQGVSINILVKNGSRIKKKGDLGKIFHHDLYGERVDKYAFLEKNNFKDVPYQAIPNVAPMYFMVPKDFELQGVYGGYFSINNLFIEKSNGGFTARDKFTIHYTKDKVEETISDFMVKNNEEARLYYKLGPDVRDWKVHLAKEDIIKSGQNFKKHTTSILYRPFDSRFTYYTGTSKGIHCMPRGKFMSHIFDKDNTAIIVGRQGQAVGNLSWNLCFISNHIVDLNVYYRGGGVLFPLYLYSDNSSERLPNLNLDEIKAFEKALNLPFKAENLEKSFVPSCLLKPFNSSNNLPTEFTPIDILDYIYAVLHSPNYRETYQEFLKTDFPKIPYPDPKNFWQLVELGDQIRLLHLMESPLLDTPITQYPMSGDNLVKRKITKTSPGYEATSDTQGKVWINDNQYFDNVPLQAWEFYIGGYQPAQKWLKDRQGRELSFDDIQHYQKIIVALTETARLMLEIDKVFTIATSIF